MERAGSLVTREEIQKALWQDQTFVDFEQGLNYCIRQIRVALEDSVERPKFVATVPRRGYRFIAEVSAVPPASPPLSLPASVPLGPEVSPLPQTTVSAFEQPGSEPPVPIATDARSRWSGIGAKARGLGSNRALVGMTALLIAAGLLYFGGGRKRLAKVYEAAGARVEDGAYPVPVRTSIAVLGFANLDGKQSDAWLATALAEMFSTELSEGGKLRLVSAEEVAKARPPLLLPESLSRETLGRLRQELGADVMVLGSYTVLTQNSVRKLRLDMRLQDARDGEILAAFSQTRDEADLFDLVSSAGASMRQRLGAGGLSPAEEASFDHSFPSDPAARRLYAEGLERLRRFDALNAREALEQVAAIEPQFAPARSALAAAWSALGYEAKAAEEAKKAIDLAGNLPREEQLSTEARYYEMAQDRPKAIDKLHTLLSFFPDNIDYGIRLATVQTQGDQNDEALATLSKLRKLPEPLGTSPRLDLLESQIHSRSGDFRQARTLAENVVRKGRAMGAQFLVAQGLLAKAFALERLGLPDASLEASSEAKQIDTDANFSRGVAFCLLSSGDVLYGKGDFDGARSRFESALSVFQEIGDRKNQGLALERIGNAYHDQGKFAQSQNEYARAREVYREVQSPMGIASATGNLANTLDAMGDLKGSLRMHQEVVPLFEQTGNKRGVASEIDNIAFVHEELGDLAAAAEGHRRSAALQRQIGHRRGEMYAVSGLGDVFLLQGDFEAARKQFEAAQNIAKETGGEDHVAVFDIYIATIDFLERHLQEAEARVRRSTAQFEKDKDPEANAEAHALLVQVLVAQRNWREAEDAGTKAAGYAGQITSQPPQFEVDLALAELEAAKGKRDVAIKRLEKVLERAGKGGYAQYTLEARRALAGLETGKARNIHLGALSDEAKRRGFGLIAVEITNMQGRETAHQDTASSLF